MEWGSLIPALMLPNGNWPRRLLNHSDVNHGELVAPLFDSEGTDMTKKKSSLSELKKLGPFLVYGLDKDGKPRGGRYPVLRDDFVSAAMDMNFQLLPVSEELAPLAAKLPLGRIYASGRVFIPPIRRPLFDKLQEVYRAWEAKGTVQQETTVEPNHQTQRVRAPNNSAPGSDDHLPADWDSIAVGDSVIAPISPDEGWWCSIVTERQGDLLTLRYRDYLKKQTFVRHISTIARVRPIS